MCRQVRSPTGRHPDTVRTRDVLLSPIFGGEALGQRTLLRDTDPAWEAGRRRRDLRQHGEAPQVSIVKLGRASAELHRRGGKGLEIRVLAEPEERRAPGGD